MGVDAMIAFKSRVENPDVQVAECEVTPIEDWHDAPGKVNSKCPANKHEKLDYHAGDPLTVEDVLETTRHWIERGRRPYMEKYS
jgi:hypothetical protein